MMNRIKAKKKPWVIGNPEFNEPCTDVPKLELESKINGVVAEFEREYAPVGVIQKINDEVLIEYADEVEEEAQVLKADMLNTIETISAELTEALNLTDDEATKVERIVKNNFRRFVGITDFKYPARLD